jgi:hypothetical protein
MGRRLVECAESLRASGILDAMKRMLMRFDDLVWLVLSGVLGFSVVALPLAMLGWFHPAPVFVGAVLAWAGLWRLWRPSQRPEGRGPSPWAVGLALLIILVVTGVNVRFASQHLLTGRDSGVYVTTGRWMADTGGILIDSHDDVWHSVSNPEDVHVDEFQFFHGHRDDGKIYPQFPNLLPAWLGAGAWIGGSRGMFKINALLGGVALLAIFAFGSRLMGGWAAVGALAALSVNLAQVYFTRDIYSEILAQALFFGGLWVLWQARGALDLRGAWVAGLLLGATVMARMDSSLLVIPLLAYVFYELWTTAGDALVARKTKGFVAALLLGVAVTSAIGWANLRFFSPPYVSGRFHLVRELLLLTVFVAGVGLAALALRSRVQPLLSRLRPLRPWLATAAMVAVVLGAFWAFALWPGLGWGPVETPHQHVTWFQEWEGVEIDATRSYVEMGMQRIGQYIGLPALALAVAGIALMSRRALMGKERLAVPFLLMLILFSAIVVGRLLITPDQIWAIRRYLPVTIPGFVLLAFWVIDRWFGWTEKLRRPEPARWLGYVAAVMAIIVPLSVLVPVAGVRSHVGMLRVTEALCDRLPEDGAVLVARGQAELLELEYVQAVRSFCQVPVAHVPMDQPMEWYQEIALAWEQEGRSLYAVSSVPDFGPHWPPGAEFVAQAEYETLERTVERVPDRYVTNRFQLYLQPVTLSP